MSDVHRMLTCSVCGGQARFGFDVTLDGLRMGDVGDWRCEDHHPTRKTSYTREEWARCRAEGREYPDQAQTISEVAA